MSAADDCRCTRPPFRHADYDSRVVGVDRTSGRYGDVTVETCRACGSLWLRYFVEYEAFSKSGRWFRARVSAETAQSVTPETSLDMIERAEPRFAGGSYFDSAGFRHVGRVVVDR